MKQATLYRKLFGDRAFYKMALAVAIPIMVQNGITQFVSLLDNIMVGQIGELQMTGVAISNKLIFVFSLAVFGAVSGAGIFGAQFFGSGDEKGVRYAFRFKLLICSVLLMLGAAVFLLFGETLISFYLRGEGTEQEIAQSLTYAKEYLYIVMLGLVPYVLTQCYASTLRECGQTIVPMLSGIASVAVNLCLNAVLIFGLLGMPKLGVAGAALATVIARFVEAAVVIVWTHRKKQRNGFIIGAYRSMRIPGALLGQIAKKTVPLLINETLWALSVALLAQCYSMHDLDIVPAHNISSTVSEMFNVAFLAMANAIGIIVGQILGANKPEEAKETDRKLIVFSVMVSIGVALVMALVSPLLPQLYNVSQDIRDMAKKFLLVVALTMPLQALSTACYFTMRSGGKALVTFLFDSVYACGVVVPLAYCLNAFTNIDIVSLFLVCQMAEIGKCTIGLLLIRKGVWVQNIVKEEIS